MTKYIYWNPFTLLELTIVIHVLKYSRVIKHKIKYSGSFCAKPRRKTGEHLARPKVKHFVCLWQFSCPGEYKAVLNWSILRPFCAQFEPVQVIPTDCSQGAAREQGQSQAPQGSCSEAVLWSSTGCREHSQPYQRWSSLSAGNGTAMKSTPREGRHLGNTSSTAHHVPKLERPSNTFLYLVSGAFNPLLWPGQSPAYCNYKLRPE